MMRLLGDAVHVHRRLGDDPEAALAAEDHLAHARAGRGASGTGRVTSMPAGVTTRTARVRSATSPYLSDCMPDERVAIQPPSVEWVKLSGKWPMVQPRALSCSSSVRAERAGLDAGDAATRRRSRGPGPCRPMSTETTVRSSSAGASRLPEMLVPPPNGMSTASASRAARTIASSSGLAAGADDDVGQATDVAGAVADEVAQALAARVDDAVQGVGRDMGGADGRLERGAQVGREGRLSDVELVEADRARGEVVGAHVDVALDERSELGLVLVREGDLLVAPAPPFHLAHRVLCSAVCPGPVRRGSGYRLTPGPE